MADMTQAAQMALSKISDYQPTGMISDKPFEKSPEPAPQAPDTTDYTAPTTAEKSNADVATNAGYKPRKPVGAGEAFARALGSGATFDVGELLNTKKNKEDWEEIKKAHPIATTIGDILGNVGSMAGTELLTLGTASPIMLARAGLLLGKFGVGAVKAAKIAEGIGKGVEVGSKLPFFKQLGAARQAVRGANLAPWVGKAADAAILAGGTALPRAAARIAGDTDQPLDERLKSAALDVGGNAAFAGIASPIFGKIASAFGKESDIARREVAKELGFEPKHFVDINTKYGEGTAEGMLDTIASERVNHKTIKSTVDALGEDATKGIQAYRGAVDSEVASSGLKPQEFGQRFVKELVGDDVKTLLADLPDETAFMRKILNAAKGENPFSSVSSQISSMKKMPRFHDAAVLLDKKVDDYSQRILGIDGQQEAKKAYARAKAMNDIFTKHENQNLSKEILGENIGGSETQPRMAVQDIVKNLINPSTEKAGLGGLGGLYGGSQESYNEQGEKQPFNLPGALVGAGAGYLGGSMLAKGMNKLNKGAIKAVPALTSPVTAALAGKTGERYAESQIAPPATQATKIQADTQSSTMPKFESAQGTPEGGEDWLESPQASGVLSMIARRNMQILEMQGQKPDGYTLDDAVQDLKEQYGDNIRRDPTVLSEYVARSPEEKKLFADQYQKLALRSQLQKPDKTGKTLLDRVVNINDIDRIKLGVGPLQGALGSDVAQAIDEIGDALYNFDASSSNSVGRTKSIEYKKKEIKEVLMNRAYKTPEQRKEAILAKFRIPDINAGLGRVGITEDTVV